jgi:hypothetical protein
MIPILTIFTSDFMITVARNFVIILVFKTIERMISELPSKAQILFFSRMLNCLKGNGPVQLIGDPN